MHVKSIPQKFLLLLNLNTRQISKSFTLHGRQERLSYETRKKTSKQNILHCNENKLYKLKMPWRKNQR